MCPRPWLIPDRAEGTAAGWVDGTKYWQQGGGCWAGGGGGLYSGYLSIGFISHACASGLKAADSSLDPQWLASLAVCEMVWQGWVPSNCEACSTLHPLMVLGCVHIFESRLRSLGP